MALLELLISVLERNGVARTLAGLTKRNLEL